MARKKKKKINMVQFVVLIALISAGFFNQETIINTANSFSEYVDNEFKFRNVQLGITEQMDNDILVYFCPEEDCFWMMYQNIRDAKFEVKCALQELDNRNLSSLFLYKHNQGLDVQVVIEGNYEEDARELSQSEVRVYSDDYRSSLMHHKFCVIDDKTVITGSTNPTENGFYYNDNNMIKIDSINLAKNFENEFNQLVSGKFSNEKSSSLEYNNLNLIFGDEKYVVSNYFCPIDNCADEIVNILSKAEEEILFAHFVLTNNDIEEVLRSKNNEGVNVSGIVETRMFNTQGSILDELSNEINIIKDTNPKTMHHKVFVVDSKYVITGSMNPTGAGDYKNDENILIIENKKIANIYRGNILNLVENNS